MTQDLTTGQRILALDYGTVRIGAAVSDPMRIIATAIETLSNGPELKNRIGKILTDYNVGMVVVGIPRTTRGTDSAKTDEVHAFVGRLRSWFAVPIRTWDERYTSVMARQSMIDIGVPRMKRREKGRVDQIAAAITLQGFLDAKGYEQR